MRKHSEPKNTLVDGIHINMILSFVYFGSYGAGMHRACLAAFISILLNSMYMISVLHLTIPEEVETEEEVEAEVEAEEEVEPEEEVEADKAEVNVNLSLKQREHGAMQTRSLSEEEDAVLYEKLYQIVEETRRRNEARSHALVRTPTSSSLANQPCETCETCKTCETCETCEDEYADMPPLIYASTIPTSYPILRNRRANIFEHNTLDLNDYYNDMPELESIPRHIPNVKEIIEASRSSILHDSLENVD